MNKFYSVICTALLLCTSYAYAAPCSGVKDLVAALACVRDNEPSFRAASGGAEEAEELKSSAYRLINPVLEFEYMDGNNLGNVDRSETASLLFTLELGGKRSARAKVLEAEGLNLRAEAFEQQIQTLTEIGGALLRLHQVESERRVLRESIDAFKRVIRLYRSRGALPPEQRVSLHTFELILIGYERKLIEADASLLRYQKRVETTFGPGSLGVPFDVKKWPTNLAKYEASFDRWVANTPEMLRVESESLAVEGARSVAAADPWPNLQIGPSVARNTQGPFQYMSYGVKATIPLPLLSWNVAERTARNLTSERSKARLSWNREDVRSKYRSMLSEMERIRALLEDTPSDEELQRKHASTESFYQRGMITGALMIESHRALVEHYEAKHELQKEYLEGILTLRHLEEFTNQ